MEPESAMPVEVSAGGFLTGEVAMGLVVLVCARSPTGAQRAMATRADLRGEDFIGGGMTQGRGKSFKHYAELRYQSRPHGQVAAAQRRPCLLALRILSSQH